MVEAKRRLGEKAELWRHEYIPIGGIQSFLKNAQSLLFGQSILNDNSERLSSIQSLSGTGALNLFAKYARQFAVEKTILIPTPTWGNHRAIFTSCDLKVGTYTYLDPKSPRKPRIDFDTTLEEVSSRKPRIDFHTAAAAALEEVDFRAHSSITSLSPLTLSKRIAAKGRPRKHDRLVPPVCTQPHRC